MNYKKTILKMLCFFSLIAVSCEAPDNLEEANLKETTDANESAYLSRNSKTNYYKLKKKFAIALHKAMTNHIEVRQFLKDEALKKFNGDYDILFKYVSDKKIGKSSLRAIIKSYYKNDADLTALETNVPSLTIFVPKLPKNSFSAVNWNVSKY